jgi:hypothetical protein
MSSRWRRIIWGVVVLVMLLPGNHPAPGVAQEKSTPPGQPSTGNLDAGAIFLRDATAGHVILELSVPDFQMEEVQADGQQYVILSAPGLDDAAAPGQPRLPQAGALIGLPPSGDWWWKSNASSSHCLGASHLPLPSHSLPLGLGRSPHCQPPPGRQTRPPMALTPSIHHHRSRLERLCCSAISG